MALPLAADTGLHLGDPWGVGLAFLGLAVFAAIGALSHEHERAFSASLIYLGLGVVAAIAIGAIGIGWIDPLADSVLIEHATELAVVIALFSTGLKLERALNWRAWSTVTRLLVIGMPLFIALAALFGTAVMGLSAGAAIVLAAALAPTDPVLAGDIGVGRPARRRSTSRISGSAPRRGSTTGSRSRSCSSGSSSRRSPASSSGRSSTSSTASRSGSWPAPRMGYGIAALMVWLRDRELLIPALDGWVAVAATLAIYGVTEALGAYGFLAVFAGGLAFRRYERDHEMNARVHDGAEIVEKFGELAVILLLGSLLTLDGLGTPGLAGWGLVLLVIFVLRPLTVNLALLGSRLQRPGERAFLAWFGVRGVGTLFYVATAAAVGSPLPRDERELIVWTAIACVVVSIAVHGVTAGPLNRFLGRNVLNQA